MPIDPTGLALSSVGETGLCPGFQAAILNGTADIILTAIDSCLNNITNSAATPISVDYLTLNYPNPDNYANNATILTGIRGIPSSSDVYICGYFTATNQSDVGVVFKGSITGEGHWYTISCPSTTGITVNSTHIYSVDISETTGYIRAVGSFDYAESTVTNTGFYYNGPIAGGGSCTAISPDSLLSDSSSQLLDTYAHSIMGDIIVGNYLEATKVNPKPFETINVYQIKPYVLNINGFTYNSLNYTNDNYTGFDTTAYGVWHNGATSYTITGGITVDLRTHGYVVNYDSKTGNASDWKIYCYDNDFTELLNIVHFQGISSNNKHGYNLAANYLNSDTDDSFKSAFTVITKDIFGHVIDADAAWYSFGYPDVNISSANSIYNNSIVGVYQDQYNISNGYIATFNFQE